MGVTSRILVLSILSRQSTDGKKEKGGRRGTRITEDNVHATDTRTYHCFLRMHTCSSHTERGRRKKKLHAIVVVGRVRTIEKGTLPLPPAPHPQASHPPISTTHNPLSFTQRRYRGVFRRRAVNFSLETRCYECELSRALLKNARERPFRRPVSDKRGLLVRCAAVTTLARFLLPRAETSNRYFRTHTFGLRVLTCQVGRGHHTNFLSPSFSLSASDPGRYLLRTSRDEKWTHERDRSRAISSTRDRVSNISRP